MSATDELRRMLTEVGVEWKAWHGVHPITVWRDETYLYEFVEYGLINDAKQVSDCPSNNDGYCELTIKVFDCTPAQAIAVTVGTGTLTAEQVSNATYAHSIHADCADADWQAIADELNDALGRVTCHEVEDEDTGFIVCSECGAVHDVSYTSYYCWCCGRKVVDE